MGRIANSHDAPWLPNSQTEMFSVYAGNARSSCLWVRRKAVPHTRALNFGHRNCCIVFGPSNKSMIGSDSKFQRYGMDAGAD